MKSSIFVAFIVLSFCSFGQKQGNIWYFGEGAGLDFNSGSPVPISGGQVFGNPQNSGEFQYSEGSAVISDSSGNLLFYSNGEKVWNRNHQVMPNGAGLMGMYSSTNSSFIVPKPLSDSLFYLFTTDGLERDLANGLRYSVINMCKEDGLGDVDIEKKNVLLLDLCTEKLCAINHQNGKDIWLIAHKFNSDTFYAYQISELGISSIVTTSVGSVHTGTGFYTAIGQMKPSPNGEQIALVFSNITPSVAELFDFDDATGVLSNPISLTVDNNEYGIEFSPDNSKLYMGNIAGLHQFDLSSGSQATINASKTTIFSGACIPSGMQLGPDGKIYVNKCSNTISVVNSPNELGFACNYVNNALSMGSTDAKVSFPSFINGYDYHTGIVDCTEEVEPDDPTGIGTNFLVNYELYPNPTNGWVTLSINDLSSGEYSFTLYDELGRVVSNIPSIQSETIEIDLQQLQNGIYYFDLCDDSNSCITDKLLLTK